MIANVPILGLVCLLVVGCVERPAAGPSKKHVADRADFPRAYTVQLTPNSLVLESGMREELSVEAPTADGSDPDEWLTWVVGDSSVVTLSGSGPKRHAEGREVGASIVVASVAGVADTTTVDVISSSTGSSGPSVVFDPDLESSTTSLRDDSQDVFSENEDLGSSRLFLDTEVGYPGGSKSMRYDWVDQGAGNAISIGRKIPLPSNAREVWVEADVRWSKNFMNDVPLDSDDGDPSTDIAAYKFLFLGASCVTSCNASWEISDGTKVWRWALLLPGPTRNPPNGPINVETPSIIETDVATDGAQIIENIRHDIAQYFDGRWHKLRIHVRHDPGAYEIWIDGQKVVDLVNQGYSNFTIRPEIATTAVLLGRNKDDGNVSGTESIWWGKVKVWTGSSGW